MTGEKLEQGVNVEYFIKNCIFLQGVLESISKRIIFAAGKTLNLLNFIGIDVNSNRVLVGWQNFLELYCTFEGG